MDNIFNSTKEYKNIDTSCNCYGDIKCKLVTKCCNKILLGNLGGLLSNTKSPEIFLF